MSEVDPRTLSDEMIEVDANGHAKDRGEPIRIETTLSVKPGVILMHPSTQMAMENRMGVITQVSKA